MSDRPTTVICVRGRDRIALQQDPDFVYDGRAMPRIGWARSAWGNPFRIGSTVRDAERIFGAIPTSDCTVAALTDRSIEIHPDDTLVDLFRKYIQSRRSLMRRVGELRGKTLGCWCGDWEPGQDEIGCHAVVLARLADGTLGRTDDR